MGASVPWMCADLALQHWLRCLVSRNQSLNSLALIAQDGSGQWTIRRNSQMRQRDEHNGFRVPRGCHIADDAGLVTGIEHVLDVYHGGKRTAISEYGERQFRTKSYACFGGSRTVVSADAEHPFRLMPNSPGC